MIPLQLLNWMRSYLEDRNQCVRLAGVLSSPRPVASSIIQDSCSVPTYFTLFIDELFEACIVCIESEAFADDVKFVADLRQFSPNVVQKDLNILYNWSIGK